MINGRTSILRANVELAIWSCNSEAMRFYLGRNLPREHIDQPNTPTFGRAMLSLALRPWRHNSVPHAWRRLLRTRLRSTPSGSPYP